jgi:hypothetical protein
MMHGGNLKRYYSVSLTNNPIVKRRNSFPTCTYIEAMIAFLENLFIPREVLIFIPLT